LTQAPIILIYCWFTGTAKENDALMESGASGNGGEDGEKHMALYEVI